MDFSQIPALVGGRKSAYDIGKAAVGVRDANQLSLVIAEMNDKLLDAQHRLFAISGEAFALQQQIADAQQESLKLKAALEERGAYLLTEIVKGNFAYKRKVEPLGVGDPSEREPVHYVCQPCFDKGTRSILGVEEGSLSSWNYVCSLCRREIYAGAERPA